jgi:hypothetical protein
MLRIVCINQNTKRPYTIASGFHDEIEARETAKDWFVFRFIDSKYDRSDGCWWLLDGGRASRVLIHNIRRDCTQSNSGSH